MGADRGCAITLGKVSRRDKQWDLSGNTALHEELEIKCFYEGSATLLVESRSISVKAGDVVVINPYEFHATVDVGEEKGAYHLFMLPLDYFTGVPELNLHRLCFGGGKKFTTLFAGEPKLYGLLMEAAEEVRQGLPGHELVVKSLLMTFFAHLLRSGMEDADGSEKSSQRLYSVVEPALRCIKNEYPHTMTVEELAGLCKVSKHYFCRVFKSVTKKSAMEYLRDYRLQVANALLSGTDSPVGEIAERCGFENPNYFSRCYKQYYGKTPRQGRQEKRPGVEEAEAGA